ncbi:gastrula zinc finger protein xFG20-1-like isoform X2 [Sitophilus oryzae]|uniref:Gastrula zinc finger protein xFG20-1-like isoform X2 n=1 Tax=Sitophilus oryzae TaxID=7048 RepID=A0A6J2XHQ1_SITOR|nr:gastrula zinc finger protein xFG20-1-like isoform X2 [Sitophilus oryzae]
MKTEQLSGSNGDPIWAGNAELLPPEECLPVIGSCQVTSILQNLDNANNDHNLQNMDLIILQGNDYKMPLDVPLNLHSNNYIVVKDPVHNNENSNANNKIISFDGILKGSNEKKQLKPTDLTLNIIETSNSSNNSSISPKHYDKESFEDMLYFVCNLCPFLCTKETKITQHLESVHKNKLSSQLVQLKCPACINIFYHRASLKSHLLHDHCVETSDINLIVQAVVFYSNKENKMKEIKINEEIEKIDLKTHVDIKKIDFESKPKLNEKKIMDMDSSSESSGHFEVPNVNIKPVQVPQKIPLPQVDITPNNSEKLITNLMKKDPVINYINSQKCAYVPCKVVLSDPKKMNYHMESHFNDGFKCLECQEKFLLWKPLTSHLWRTHKVDLDLYSCDKCDYKTNSLSKLNTIHKLTHSNVKAFRCEICAKPFKNQKQVRNHKRIHRDVSDKKHLICELCSKNFPDKRRLRSHMDSVHKKIKPFLCNYCGYKGSSRASLKMHIRSHTGEKPFSCDQCSYSTSDHNSLRRHKLRHTGHKPYKCSYCSYACIQSSTYKVHLKTKHPGMEKDLMFTCFLCQYRTVNKGMYSTHMITIHKQNMPCS